jgi:DNA-binding NarL/FixJ family response regulator
MLVGRGPERACLRRMLAEARQGRGGALVLEGEPGIGKSSLLADAVSAASGMRVLRACGIEVESELAFAGLADVARGLECFIDELPTAQAAALRSALALGLPVSADRLAIGAATLGVLAAAAIEPLLVVVDDVQWLDTSSVEALAFAARRLNSEPIAVVFATRAAGDERLAGLTRIKVIGLDAAVAPRLLPDDVHHDVASALVTATGGNPLALIELPALLSDAQRRGQEPLPAPLPLRPALARAFGQRLASLPDASQRALVAVAASETGSLADLGAALPLLQLDLTDLQPAETGRFVSLTGTEVRFAHPLLRAAAYAGAAPIERRRAHAALADVAATLERRAWHRAAATIGPDDETASLLEAAGRAASARGGHAAAMTAFERSAEFTATTAERASRLLLAAAAAELAGASERCVALVDVALTHSTDALERADLEQLRARVMGRRSRDLQHFHRLFSAAATVRDRDPIRATLMYLDAALLAAATDDIVEFGQALANLKEIAASATDLPYEAAFLLAEVEWGPPSPEPRRVHEAPDWDLLLSRADDLAAAHRLIGIADMYSYRGWDVEHTRALFARVVDVARLASAGGILAEALTALALLDHRISRWRTAASEAEEGYRLALETDRPLDAIAALAVLARIESARGSEPDCRRHAAEAWALAHPLGLATIPDWHANVALGLLELGLGRPDEAVRRLEIPAGDIDTGGLSPGVFRAAGDLIEAYIRSGRTSKAQRTLNEFERRARDGARRWALAVAARCRGLMAADDDLDAHFEEALALHAQDPFLFEQARTQLAYGERLRRAHRRTEARGHLRMAAEGFDALGSRIWGDRARTELRASGQHLGPGMAATLDELTPQELQLARIVAGGATNREAAQALFISPKTVEAHLGAIYRKLGMRSRTELANRLASDSPGTVHETQPSSTDA